MVTGIRHKAVLVLGCLLVAVVMACGGGPSEAESEATVEARVELAKASLVAPTAAPLPTYTPMPTYTPAPAPAPEVVVKEVIVEKPVEVVVEKEVVKEIIVEKIVEVVVTPTPTAASIGTLDAHPWVNPYNSLIVNIDITLGAPAKVFVEYGNPKAGRFRSRTSEYANTSHQLSLVRLRPLTTYSYEVFIVDEKGVGSSSWQGTFRTGPLPVGLRHFVTIARGESTYPLTLKEHNDGDFMGMVVLDSQANVVWYYESSNGEVRAIGQKSNGNLIYVANLSGLREITPLGEEVNRLDETCMTSEAQGQIHHEVLIRPDNKVLYLSSAIHVKKRPFIQPQTSDIIGEWNQKNGTSRILFDLFDFIPFSDRTSDSNVSASFSWKGCHGAPVDVQDWTHSNSLFVGGRGNVIMSIRHLDQIISIAPDFQSVEWRLGGPSSDFIFPNSGDQFYHQHSAVALANGNILLFDNGNSRPDAEGGEYSRALELHLDFDDMSARKVWQYRHEPDLFAACCSNVTRLENGNTVLVFGADFAREDCCRVFTLIEADPSGEKVFEIQMRSLQMPLQYRVYPISSINGETQMID